MRKSLFGNVLSWKTSLWPSFSIVNSRVFRFSPTGLYSYIQSHPNITSYPLSSRTLKSDVNCSPCMLYSDAGHCPCVHNTSPFATVTLMGEWFCTLRLAL
uniref:Uncharacterized protein n=1 Tax=Arundo donax TaxID=35708 RepID=A0A0A8ZKJ7_ARUDO